MREGRPGIEDVEGGGGVGDLKLQGSDRRLTLQGVECTGREMERKGEEREKIEGGRQVDRYRTDSTDSLDHGVLVLILILAQPALGAEEESKARQYQSRRRKQKGWRQGCLIHCPERRRMAARPRMVSQAKLELGWDWDWNWNTGKTWRGVRIRIRSCTPRGFSRNQTAPRPHAAVVIF